jgi:GNAT superfamily N-acetyltransferase
MAGDPAAYRLPTTLPSGSVVRAATVDDAPELLRLVHELAAYEREPDAVKATAADYEAILFPSAGNPTGFCEVGEVAGRVVAMAFWYVTFSTWSGKPGIWLEDLYVEPEHRGSGLGDALLARLARLCVQRGYARLEWWVLDWNQPSIDFYRSRGAAGLDDWTHFRIDGTALSNLGAPDPHAR